MRLLLGFILVFFIGLCAQAQTVKPIRWTISLSKKEVKQGETIEIIMRAEINSDWYLYSSDFDPNLGPTVTSVAFEKSEGYKPTGALKAIDAKEKYDSLWEGKVRYFTKHAEFRQKIKILKTNPVLKGILMYQVCSDKEGKCIPYEEPIFFDNLKVAAAAVEPEENTTKPTQQNPTSEDRLQDLESQKSKLVQKDKNGNDVAKEQLKEFAQKYGGDQ
jgi:thiol:disulfide interchange protein DsbD